MTTDIKKIPDDFLNTVVGGTHLGSNIEPTPSNETLEHKCIRCSHVYTLSQGVVGTKCPVCGFCPGIHFSHQLDDWNGHTSEEWKRLIATK